MCGTDFNNNIPNIGDGRAFNHIKKHRSIEEFSKASKKDCSILNYKRSRQLLTAPECDIDFDSEKLRHSPENFDDTAKDLSVQYGLLAGYNKLQYHINRDIKVSPYDIKTAVKSLD
jgi:hypothetical protein